MKKEEVGNFKNDGAEYRPKAMPSLVNDYDFCDKKALPYGIYNVGYNKSFVNVGVSTNTGQFVIKSISSWWFLMRQYAYPDTKKVMITRQRREQRLPPAAVEV